MRGRVLPDSEYLKNGVTRWLGIWKANGWKTKAKKPVKNEELWRSLDAAVANHKITWAWLKGHSGHAENERCDQLANEQIALLKKAFSAEQLKAMLAEFAARENATSTEDILSK